MKNCILTSTRYLGKQLFTTAQSRLILTMGLITCVTSIQAQTNTLPDQMPVSSDNTDLNVIAKKLANPLASLVSVPFQNNFDFGGGWQDKGFRYTLDVQPVIPFSLNENWNLITRTIIPFVHQDNFAGNTSQTGLSDTALSLFLAPNQPLKSGPLWGVGTEFSLPTATETLLGSGKWGLGPSGLILEQHDSWIYGALVSQLWSVVGDKNRSSISATALQPFLAYITKMHTTYALGLDATYDWMAHEWTAPFNLGVAQLVKIGPLPVSIEVGGRYFPVRPDSSPQWGLRLAFTFVLAK